MAVASAQASLTFESKRAMSEDEDRDQKHASNPLADVHEALANAAAEQWDARHCGASDSAVDDDAKITGAK